MKHLLVSSTSRFLNIHDIRSAPAVSITKYDVLLNLMQYKTQIIGSPMERRQMNRVRPTLKSNRSCNSALPVQRVKTFRKRCNGRRSALCLAPY